MSLLFHPHDILRRYALASVDGGIGWDETYYLVFTASGMSVRAIRDYSQDYKTPDVSEIQSSAFPETVVNGVTLLELVSKKLAEIGEPPACGTISN